MFWCIDYTPNITWLIFKTILSVSLLSLSQWQKWVSKKGLAFRQLVGWGLVWWSESGAFAFRACGWRWWPSPLALLFRGPKQMPLSDPISNSLSHMKPKNPQSRQNLCSILPRVHFTGHQCWWNTTRVCVTTMRHVTSTLTGDCKSPG